MEGNDVMNDCFFDEKTLSEWHNLHFCKSTNAEYFFQGMTYYVRFTFSVDDTTHGVCI